jgi:hypothetical protein
VCSGIVRGIEPVPTGALFRFRTPAIQLEVKLSELADGQTQTFPTGGVDLGVFPCSCTGCRRAGMRATSRSSTLTPRLCAAGAICTGFA